MNSKLSLLKFCIPCNAKCCKHGETIGSPILDEQEMKKIKKVLDKEIKEVVLENGKKYYVIIVDEKEKRCPYLSKDNKCLIQEVKPLDCAIYPIKAVYVNDEPEDDTIKFVVDSDCPASKHLSKEFIEEAKKLSVESLKRFDKQTFNHWLNNYIGWVQRYGVDLDEFFDSV